MDNARLFSEIERSFPGATLQIQKFGRGASAPCIWIESRRLADIARMLKSDFKLDLLENLSVMQVDEALVATYFVTSYAANVGADDSVILRVTIGLPQGRLPEICSVGEIWEMAPPLEAEAAELFGIRFVDSSGKQLEFTSSKLMSGWKGFPLRKDYVFPAEVDGVRHQRGWPEREKAAMAGERGGENALP